MVRRTQLSPLDKVMVSPTDKAQLGFTILYVFPPVIRDATVHPYDLEGVHRAFVELIEQDYPEFLGKLVIDADTHAVYVETEDDADAKRDIPFTIEHDDTLSTDHAVAQAPLRLMPTRGAPDQLITVKCTRLQDDGLAIGIDMSHCLVDGEGCFTFMKTWGCRYRNVPDSERPRIHGDRQVLASRGVSPALDHPEFRVVQSKQQTRDDASTSTTATDQSSTPIKPPSAIPAAQMPTTTQRMFRVTPERMRAIKTLATSSDGAYVSTVDGLTALFTILITQARGHNQDVRMTTGVNGRRRFDPPLPDNYPGNVIFNALSTYEASELATLSVESLQRVAKRIRGSIVARTDAYMRDAIEFITAHGELQVNTNFFLGPDLMFTSWTHMGVYDADFGARPWYACAPTLPLCDGLVVILEATRLEAGLDVLVLLETSAMARLVELWNAVLFW